MTATQNNRIAQTIRSANGGMNAAALIALRANQGTSGLFAPQHGAGLSQLGDSRRNSYQPVLPQNNLKNQTPGMHPGMPINRFRKGNAQK